jgi:hypothetical protein
MTQLIKFKQKGQNVEEGTERPVKWAKMRKKIGKR